MKTLLAPELAPENTLELKIADRCDRCIAQAFVIVAKDIDEKEYTLYFCGHHYSEHEAALLVQGFVKVTDNRHLINEKPTPTDDEE